MEFSLLNTLIAGTDSYNARSTRSALAKNKPGKGELAPRYLRDSPCEPYRFPHDWL